jgi:PKD repeat protein
MSKFLIILCACLCLARTALGWGQEGHMVVAQIAYNHLSPAVRAQCDALIAVNLGTYSSSATSNFVMAASWADDFKSSLGTGTSHYIDLPLCINGLAVSNTGTCTGTCADNVCTNDAPPEVPNIVTALNQYISVLLDANATQSSKATALRYIIHYVGDIEQPLHASNGISTSDPPPGGDAGGNGINVGRSNLHSFWDGGAGYLSDSGINRPLSGSGYSTISNKAADVEATYPYSPSIGTIPDPMTWALDSYSYAKTNVYYYLENGVLTKLTEGVSPDSTYTNQARACSKQRMAMGGKRLADLLMTIFSTNAASFTASPTNGTASLLVTFTDTSTGSITNWFWNFGDGNTTNFTASTNSAHTYAAGTYNVTLIVSGYGGSSTNTKSNYIVVDSSSAPPVASFSASLTNGAAALSVSFMDTSTGGVPTSWSWSFSDGNTSTAQNPQNTYINPGAYSAQLIASNASGWSTNSATIHVYSPYDWWQLFYFGATNNAGDGAGMSNTNKFLAGFNPTDPAAYLHIISIAITNVTDISVIYLGANGDSTYLPGIASRTNVLEFSTGAADGSYASDNFASTGQTNILSGGTGLGVVTNMVDTGGATNFPSRYYRVRVLVP